MVCSHIYQLHCEPDLSYTCIIQCCGLTVFEFEINFSFIQQQKFKDGFEIKKILLLITVLK